MESLMKRCECISKKIRDLFEEKSSNPEVIETLRYSIFS